jgi:hypothetical protein
VSRVSESRNVAPQARDRDVDDSRSPTQCNPCNSVAAIARARCRAGVTPRCAVAALTAAIASRADALSSAAKRGWPVSLACSAPRTQLRAKAMRALIVDWFTVTSCSRGQIDEGPMRLDRWTAIADPRRCIDAETDDPRLAGAIDDRRHTADEIWS